METKQGLYYSKEHEWVRVEGDTAFVGITDFAQSHMGDIVYVEMPEAGAEFSAMEMVGVIESVKAAADMHTPLAGAIVKINEALETNPAMLNSDPYGSWIFSINIGDPADLDNLMDAAAYEAFCAAE